MKKPSSWVLKSILFGFLLLLCAVILFILLYNHISEQYAQSDPMLKEIKQQLLQLHPLIKNIAFYEGKKSYTINKKKIYLCLRDPVSHEYYPQNMLMYVAIHELAHVLCNEIGHTARFQEIFHELLSQAHEIGIYDPHQPILRDYCL